MREEGHSFCSITIQISSENLAAHKKKKKKNEEMEEESPMDAIASSLTGLKHLCNSRPLNLEAVFLFVLPFLISCFSLVPPTKKALQMPDRIALPLSFDLVQLILVHLFHRDVLSVTFFIRQFGP